jgi:hypothetical protein
LLKWGLVWTFKWAVNLLEWTFAWTLARALVRTTFLRGWALKDAAQLYLEGVATVRLFFLAFLLRDQKSIIYLVGSTNANHGYLILILIH